MKYFKISEFDSKDEPGSGSKMQPSTLAMIDAARGFAGIPFTVNSGYRSPNHNASVGGSKTSSHMGGWAVDIAVNSNTKAIIISACKRAGFVRMGVGKTFVHVDNDPTKPAANWVYS